MGKAKNTTIGYMYFMDLHMGLVRGPIDELCEIRVGDRLAWEGSQTEPGRITINKPSLFGGTKAEGGIDGWLDLYMGGPDQVVSSTLKAMLGGNQPEFRGFASAHYSGEICAMSPYPKSWAFRMRRVLKGWEDDEVWYAAKAKIIVTGYSSDGTSRDVVCMNPIHVIYECITNSAWGRGMPKTELMEDTWRYAADQCFAEGLGVCIRWTRQDTLGSFVQTIMDHVNGMLYVDKFTGKFRIKLARFDYDPDALPIFDTDSGLLAITEATNAATDNMVNEIVVTYNNVVDNEDGQVRVHNLASIQMQGSLNSNTKEYKGIPNADLAIKLAQRDLKVSSTNVRRFNLTLDRRAWHLQPGDVIKIRDPDTRGLETVIVRIGTTEEADVTDGSIKIVGVQDTFTFELNTFTDVEPPGHVTPDTAPKIGRHRTYEMTYPELVEKMPPGEFNAIQGSYGYIAAHAEKATPVVMSFDINVKPEGMANYETTGSGEFTPLADLELALDYLDTTLTLSGAADMDEIEVGFVALIGDEFIRIDAIDLGPDEKSGTFTIARGVYDTIPQRHAAGTTIWVTTETGGTDWVVYAGGEHVDIKLVPWTLSGGRFPLEDTPVDEIDFNFRWYRPFAPGLVMTETQGVGALHWYGRQVLRADVGESEVPDNLTITWAHRDRPLQADKRIDHMQGDIGPEPGSTYRIIVKNPLGQTVRTETGIIGTQWVYSYANAAADLSVETATTEPQTGTITLETMRDGYASWMKYTMLVDVYKKPPQTAQVASFAMQAMQEYTADPSEPPLEDLSGMNVALLANPVSQESDMSDSSTPGIDGTNVALLANPVSQVTILPTVMDYYLYEFPYLSLLRDGRDTTHSQVMGMVARPSDRLTDGYNMFDRLTGETNWTDNGSQPWTPWGTLKGFMHFLTNEFEVDATSDTDGVPIDALQVNDVLLIDNELMVVQSINGKRLKVGRGSVDTVPAVHYANRPVWLFDRQHAAANRLYGDTDIAQVIMQPHSYSEQIPLNQLGIKSLQLQTRPRRPYAPGLMLCNGQHWYETIRALKADFDVFNPAGGGIDAIFTWAHRNRLSQGDTAVDHFAVGISPEAGLQYKIWIGYTNRDANRTKTTLHEAYTEDAGWVYHKELAEVHGERAGRALVSPGFVTIQVVVNAVRDGLFNWQGYGFNVTIPSYPADPGDKPGGDTTPPTPNYPDPGTPNPPDPTEPSTPGDGGTVDPTPDPEDPTPPTDPSVPPTTPPGPDPEPEPDPDNVPGWSISWDHGWAEYLPNQTATGE